MKLLTAILVGCLVGASLQAVIVSEGIVKTVEGIAIPIVIHRPDQSDENCPVVFHVHGGGWNGGTKTVVPPATVGPVAGMLCDRLGIIFVGLGYRCKNQKGTFELAMGDLHDSVKWFNERADSFGADLSRIGFSGGSAGTPLSALMAQQIPNCQNYLGLWGVYDFTNHKKSLFPNEEALQTYTIAAASQATAASAFHQLRASPPTTLLRNAEAPALDL
jgi:acetyl esterase/lipase